MLWSMCLVTTAVGFYLAGLLPGFVTLGLVFLNPIYFMLVFVADARHRARVLALAFGAVAGPPLHLVSPDWGLLTTGVLAGSLAFSAALVLPATARNDHAGCDGSRPGHLVGLCVGRRRRPCPLLLHRPGSCPPGST